MPKYYVKNRRKERPLLGIKKGHFYFTHPFSRFTDKMQRKPENDLTRLTFSNNFGS